MLNTYIKIKEKALYANDFIKISERLFFKKDNIPYLRYKRRIAFEVKEEADKDIILIAAIKKPLSESSDNSNNKKRKELRFADILTKKRKKL